MGRTATGDLRSGGGRDDRVRDVLDAYIIEDIRRREEQRRQEEEQRRPRLHIDPVAPPAPERAPERTEEEEDGVVRIDIDAPTVPLRQISLH